MSPTIRLVLALHDHQPVGNFDDVFERAFQDSYQPLLDVFESYPALSMALHTSGSLLEWLDQRHPEYVDRLADLAAAGRIEIIGGAFYEPILTMLSRRDRIGQITAYTDWLRARLRTDIRGMWVPERVWEQSLAGDLATAGIEYTLLDDFHFKSASLTEEELYGYYVTEDDGKVLKVLPGSERLRYLIPFAAPQETIDYLGAVAAKHPGSVLVLADDGEKFGIWPDTKQHVFTNGWLRQFFDLLTANANWIQVTTPGEVLDNVAPLGKVYLPEGSYREMTEWALPADQITRFERVRHELEHDPRWPTIAPLIRGGFWRNFKRKYPEADEMYTRMQMVSRRLHEAAEAGLGRELLDRARTELYRGQCNCGYWHGAFGGIYLPHLRHAVYRHLIAADNLLDEACGRPVQDDGDGWVAATSGDFNLDARPEVRLASNRLLALIAPAQGGQIYELDVRDIQHNLLATLARRPEAYHARVLAGASDAADDVASIHDRVVCKQEGLDRKIIYDAHARKSLLDHFYQPDVSLDQIVAGQAVDQGDFPLGKYTARIRRNPDRVQVVLTREGHAGDVPVKITKGVTLDAGSPSLQIAYLLENLPAEQPLLFAVELNFAGLPAGAEGRYFHDADHDNLGDLGRQLDLADARSIGLIDQWLGIDVDLAIDRPTGIWTFPVQSVNQSEGGFELVHQSVVVLPHWTVRGDDHGRWSVTMALTADTSAAARRVAEAAVVATP